MGCRRTPRCFPAGGWAIPRARPTRWPCASRAAPLPSPVAGLRGLSSDRPTRVGVGITRPIGGGLAAWLAHRPPWIVVVAGLVAVAALGYVDFATGPELTPLLFYLAPVALVAWYAGRGPGLGVACAGAIAWLLSDALTHGAYAHWSIPYWNGVLRLGALALAADLVARLREAAARERDQERADPRTGVANLRAFYELAEAEIARARRYPHAFSVVYIDLDEFKLVNFRLGHEAGDAVLRSVARGRGGGRAADRGEAAPGAVCGGAGARLADHGEHRGRDVRGAARVGGCAARGRGPPHVPGQADRQEHRGARNPERSAGVTLTCDGKTSRVGRRGSRSSATHARSAWDPRCMWRARRRRGPTARSSESGTPTCRRSRRSRTSSARSPRPARRSPTWSGPVCT